MNNLTLIILLILAIFQFLGCSSTPILTKYNSPILRIMVDPDSISNDQYIKLVYSLKRSGKWIVVDRAAGFRAAQKEQNIQHVDQKDRFKNSQKYAHWGELYGVRGIIVAHADCAKVFSTFSGNHMRCDQDLQILDANTGEILAVSQAISKGNDGWTTPHWDEAVNALNETFPKRLDTRKDHSLVQYELDSERRAK